MGNGPAGWSLRRWLALAAIVACLPALVAAMGCPCPSWTGLSSQSATATPGCDNAHASDCCSGCCHERNGSALKTDDARRHAPPATAVCAALKGELLQTGDTLQVSPSTIDGLPVSVGFDDDALCRAIRWEIPRFCARHVASPPSTFVQTVAGRCHPVHAPPSLS